MKEIKYIDIADNQVWMIYLMPFSKEKRTDYNIVLSLQEKCIEKNMFGMGWALSCLPEDVKMTEENITEYVKQYNAQGGSVSERAIEGYKEIKKGDYVITRLKNGHYYVGKISSDGAYFIHKVDNSLYGMFSWGGTVEKWYEFFKDDEVPSEIVGRFSQRLHSTIQKIVPYRQRMLVIAMYEKKLQEDESKSAEYKKQRLKNVPKLHIGINNFVRSLSYMDLEDLVAFYIIDKHASENYRLLPSSCKISQQNYEFLFIAKCKKPITCQVKNQKEIEIEHYKKDANFYEKIYLFSGKWDNEEVENKRIENIEYPNIYIISPKELYDTLIANDYMFENDFYDFCGETIRPEQLCLKRYNCVKKIKSETDYTRSEDFACFITDDGLFYSSEFEALILSWHIIPDDVEKEKTLVEKICDDLNNGWKEEMPEEQ